MAKVAAPLFSFGARGQLGSAIVYFPWKGIAAVRTYVHPANPRSAGQQTQRGYLGDAVDLWHTLGLTADDVGAWNRYATTLPKPQSGFNAFVKYVIDRLRFPIVLADLRLGFNGDQTNGSSGNVDMMADFAAAPNSVAMHYGVSPTSLINEAAAGNVAGTWSTGNQAFAVGAILYWTAIAKNVGGDEIGRTGIYRFGPVT